MIRRLFVAILAVGLLAVPLAADGQPVAKIPRVGFLDFGRAPSPEEMAKDSFAQAMREVGRVDGQNILIERRYRESDDQLRASAAELVRLRVDVVVVPSCGLAKIVQTESSTIPIVINSCGYDLVAGGFAASLARPGGNITGSQVLGADLIGKRVQLLKELLPDLSRFATLAGRTTLREINPTARNSYGVAADVAAQTLSMQRDHFVVDRPEDVPAVFRGMVEKRDRGLLVWGSPVIWALRKRIVEGMGIANITLLGRGGPTPGARHRDIMCRTQTRAPHADPSLEPQAQPSAPGTTSRDCDSALGRRAWAGWASAWTWAGLSTSCIPWPREAWQRDDRLLCLADSTVPTASRLLREVEVRRRPTV